MNNPFITDLSVINNYKKTLGKDFLVKFIETVIVETDQIFNELEQKILIQNSYDTKETLQNLYKSMERIGATVISQEIISLIQRYDALSLEERMNRLKELQNTFGAAKPFLRQAAQ